jgi:uncharacterized membrane protein YuzA (DUF378 family)
MHKNSNKIIKNINIKSISVFFCSALFILFYMSAGLVLIYPQTASASNIVQSSDTSLGGDAVSPTYSAANSCDASSITNLKSLITYFVGCLLVPLVYIIIGLAVFIFVFGIFKIITSESPEEKQKGRDLMLWGIIGIFVMVSLWGLVNILQGTFTLNNTDINPRQVTIPNL